MELLLGWITLAFIVAAAFAFMAAPEEIIKTIFVIAIAIFLSPVWIPALLLYGVWKGFKALGSEFKKFGT